MTKVTDEEFEKTVLENDIFGRVTPEQKTKNGSRTAKKLVRLSL